MIRMRPWSVPAFFVLLAPCLWAQEKAAPANKPDASWAIDDALVVTPKGPPVPALNYRLLPLSSELKEGNAVPIYLRLAHEQDDAARRELSETPRSWNALPLDKIPLDEARKFLQNHRYQLRQLEVGARRRTVEWDYTLDEPKPISLLLPDAQWMRHYSPALTLQVRVALAEGDFPAAAHHLETAFAFARHVADGPTLIHKMVGFALARDFTSAVTDFVEQSDAPNLYWALTALPRPLIDPRRAQEWEYRMLEMEYPELADLDRRRTPEQWDEILHRLRAELQGLALTPEPGQRKLPDWFPRGYGPDNPAAQSPDLPAARAFVARTKGLTAGQVEALPPSQVLLLHMVGSFHEDRDDYFRGMYLPYPQAFPLFEAAQKRLKDAPIGEGHLLARILLPALDRVTSIEVRIERTLAALRVVEALRMYAAAHQGKLPDNLTDVTEVAIPNDPGTGRPFEYHRAGDTATLISQVPNDPIPNNGLRYRVTMRKK